MCSVSHMQFWEAWDELYNTVPLVLPTTNPPFWILNKSAHLILLGELRVVFKIFNAAILWIRLDSAEHIMKIKNAKYAITRKKQEQQWKPTWAV